MWNISMNYAEGHGGPIACTAQEINSDLDLYSHAVHVCICVCVCERERESGHVRILSSYHRMWASCRWSPGSCARTPDPAWSRWHSLAWSKPWSPRDWPGPPCHTTAGKHHHNGKECLLYTYILIYSYTYILIYLHTYILTYLYTYILIY